MPSPHRIAFGITDLDPGGAERMLTELVTRLDRNEWEPHVYCLGPEAYFSSVMRDHGIQVTCFHATGTADVPRVVWKWRQKLRRFRPEILYTWLFHANILGRFAGKWAGVSHILSGIRVAERRHAWHLRLDRWTNRLVEKNVCVSRGVAQFVERTGGLDPQKSVVIANAVDGKRFEGVPPADLTRFGVPPGCPVVITIGRLDYQKGVDVLVDAIPHVRQRHSAAHFLIVGDGPERSALERRAKSLGLENQVHFVGRQTGIPALLAASTLLVLPSRWEGMPNVVLEALAAGKPVIATQVEGTEDLVVTDLNGWLVPSEQAPDLAKTMTVALGNLERLSKMGLESQITYNKYFTIDKFVAAHVELFQNVLK